MPTNPDVAWAVEDVRARLTRYAKFRNYWAGKHNLTFATDKFVNAFGPLFQELSDNLCDDVVDEPVGRLRILGWSGPTKELGQDIQDWWDANRGGPRSKTVHRRAFREGDGFTIIWPDAKGIPRLYVQRSEQMAVRYDDDVPDLVAVAAKVWRDGKRYRLTLYYPDRMERFATKGLGAEGGLPRPEAFQPLPPEKGPGGVDLTPEQVNEWGRMPVFHLPQDEISAYGRSVLDDVIPLQDALNKSVCDMLVAGEFHALPQRWGVGITLEHDPETGKEVNPFKSGAERFWRTGNENAQFGQFAQADLAGFLAQQNDLRMEIARKGCLPPWSVNLQGAVPSGTSLLVLDGRAVKRAGDAQENWGPAWREMAALAMTMSGKGEITGDMIDMEWGPAATRDEQALVETLQGKVALGVSNHQALLEMGYDEDKISEMEEAQAEADARKFEQQQTMAGGRLPASPQAAARLSQALGLPAAPPAPGPGAPPLTLV